MTPPSSPTAPRSPSAGARRGDARRPSGRPSFDAARRVAASIRSLSLDHLRPTAHRRSAAQDERLTVADSEWRADASLRASADGAKAGPGVVVGWWRAWWGLVVGGKGCLPCGRGRLRVCQCAARPTRPPTHPTSAHPLSPPLCQAARSRWRRWRDTGALAYGALGVVYGDLMTSPLYTLTVAFPSPPAEAEVLGAISMVVWTLLLVVVLKYASIVLRADDDGQGGAFALTSILRRQAAAPGGGRLGRGLETYSRGPEAAPPLLPRGWLRTSSRLASASGPTGGGSGGEARDPEAGATRPSRPDWRQRLVERRWLQRAIHVLAAIGVGNILASRGRGLVQRWHGDARSALQPPRRPSPTNPTATSRDRGTEF